MEEFLEALECNARAQAIIFATVERALAQLHAENARLRTELDDYRVNTTDMDEYRKLVDELQERVCMLEREMATRQRRECCR